MKIKRSFGLGRLHEVVECGDMVYLAGVTSDEKGIAAQVGDVLNPQYTTIFPEPRQQLVKSRRRPSTRASSPWRIRAANRQGA